MSCADASCKTVTMNPDSTLSKRRMYTVKIQGVADREGNELARAYSKSFKSGTRQGHKPERSGPREGLSVAVQAFSVSCQQFEQAGLCSLTAPKNKGPGSSSLGP